MARFGMIPLSILRLHRGELSRKLFNLGLERGLKTSKGERAKVVDAELKFLRNEKGEVTHTDFENGSDKRLHDRFLRQCRPCLERDWSPVEDSIIQQIRPALVEEADHILLPGCPDFGWLCAIFHEAREVLPTAEDFDRQLFILIFIGGFAPGK